MNALTKFSIALLLAPATATAIYFYVLPDDAAFRGRAFASPLLPNPRHGTLQNKDQERLSQLQGKGLLVEALNFRLRAPGACNCGHNCRPSWIVSATLPYRLPHLAWIGLRLARPPPATLRQCWERRRQRWMPPAHKTRSDWLRLRAARSDEEAARFTQELRCETLEG